MSSLRIQAMATRRHFLLRILHRFHRCHVDSEPLTASPEKTQLKNPDLQEGGFHEEKSTMATAAFTKSTSNTLFNLQHAFQPHYMIQRIARSPNSTAMTWSRDSTSSYRMSIFCTTIYTAKLHTSCHDSFTCQPKQNQPHSMMCAIVAYAVNNGKYCCELPTCWNLFFCATSLAPEL